MLFTSLQCIVFFSVVLALNQALRHWPLLQKLMLLLASYYFYAQWDWHYLFLVWFSTLVDYTIGLLLPRSPNPKRLIVISVIVNLGFLAIFKYANWVIASINGGAAALGSDLHITPLDVLLPVGISFYTFQSLSYTGVLPPARSRADCARTRVFRRTRWTENRTSD
jgi:alginate O-acetyltransferase complex protein AlgI